MKTQNKQFYLGALNQEQLDTLNSIVEHAHYPADFEWSDYPLPEAFKDEIIGFVNSAITNKGNKAMAIPPGIFHPMPTKAPPPRYLKVGNEIVEIKAEYDSMNIPETLEDKNLYSFIVTTNGQGIHIQVYYNHPQYAIEGYSIAHYDILHDAVDLNSQPIENKLFILKMREINNTPNTSINFSLSPNPTRLSIASMLTIPVSIFNEVKNNRKTFHIYQF